MIELRCTAIALSVDSSRIEIETTTSCDRNSERLSLELVEDLLRSLNATLD